MLLPAFVMVGCENGGDDNNPDGGGKDPGSSNPASGRKVIKITETAEFESDYYGSGSNGEYEPHTYKFGYDDKGRLTEYYAANDNEPIVLDYDTEGEVLVHFGDFADLAELNAEGNVSKLTYDDTGDGYTFTYSDGYISGGVKYEYGGNMETPFRFNWTNGNMTSSENENWDGEFEEYSLATFAPQLNSNTGIDLNTFLFGSTEVPDIYMEPSNDYTENILAMAGLAGKPSKNYMVARSGTRGIAGYEEVVYTESTEPEVGTIVHTDYYRDYYGLGTWTFDSEGFPTSFSHKVEVEKSEDIYNGERYYITPEQEGEEQWLDMYGPGPYFYLVLDNNTTTKYDTYSYRIEYAE